MANTSGGVILLGAKELKDGSLEFCGLGDITRVETDLWNQLQNPQKVSANILHRDSVERVEVDGADLLLIHVPKASRADRPLFINDSWETGTFVRVHEGDRRVAKNIARRMLADAIDNRDAQVLDDYTLDDLHENTVRRYREFFAARRPEHPYLEKDDDGFLIAIGAAKRQRRDNDLLRPTWAGLLMLGDELAIRDLFPHWHLSFKELPEDPADSRRWLDRVHPDGTWNANIFAFYLRVIRKLHDGLKVPFEIEQGQFRKDETPVHIAVREALVNTLIHADYRGTTGVRIIKRRSGFEFINPGLLLISAEQLWNLELRLESLFPEQVVEELVRRFGESFTGQDELGRIILATAEVEDDFNHATICALSDEHPRDITLKLQELVRQNLLRSQGSRRGTTYSPQSTGQSTGQSTENSSEISVNDHEFINEIASTNWAPAKQIRHAIKLFCSDDFKSAQEIADALNRTLRTIRRNYLSKMVADGELQTRFSKIKHPAQAYRAIRPKGPNEIRRSTDKFS